MFGLAVLVVLGIYLLISFFVVRWAINYARKNGKSAKRWGWGAAFVMYSIVFWDWIPTVAVHQFYCAKDSGFWVYKTLDQWKQENPGVMETLVDNSPNEYPNWPSENWNGKRITSINQRFGLLYKDHLSMPEEGELFFHVWRWETEMVDKRTGEVLARRISYTSGNDGYIGGVHSLKFWLVSDGCLENKKYSKDFREFLNKFRGARN